jgi:hypothetical protein
MGSVGTGNIVVLDGGIVNMFDATGGMLANLKFAGTGDLYAAPTTGMATNYVAITSHPGWVAGYHYTLSGGQGRFSLPPPDGRGAMSHAQAPA